MLEFALLLGVISENLDLVWANFLRLSRLHFNFIDSLKGAVLLFSKW